jgi:sulfur carrier protein ThiS
MMHCPIAMQVHLSGRDHDLKIEVEHGQTVRQVLTEANILPSTVIVSFEGTILPHSTILSGDVALLVTTVSSGG